MTGPTPGATTSGRWYAAGDVNAFFGLAVDNLTNLVVLAGLLVGVFGFPSDLVLYRIVPGTALGVLAGDLCYTWLARRLARQTGRADVTAMPFGIDTPSLFGVTFGVLGPTMLATGDPVLAWKVGMGVTVAMGVAKLALAFAGEWVRRIVPRAGLLGSIAGVSVLLIAFLPMLKVITDPLVGFLSLGLILVALVGRIALPGRVPGALAAVAVGTAVYVVERWAGIAPSSHVLMAPGEWRLAIPWPTLAWLDAPGETWGALSVALPFALATVIGGIDNTESAIAAGDRYRTRDILLTEALATILAGVTGGVIQNTPYVGHPAYKAMGARAGYTLATGLVIGLGAMAGVVSLLVGLVPEAAVAPILVFVGLEITAQAFLATPPRHAPAVALAFVPTTAALVMIELSGILGSLGLGPGAITGRRRPHRPGAAPPRQRLHPVGAPLGGGGRHDHRSPAPGGGRVPLRGEPGKPLRDDPLAARIGRALLAGRERVRPGPVSWPAVTVSSQACSCCSRPWTDAARAAAGRAGGEGHASLTPARLRCYIRSRCL